MLRQQVVVDARLVVEAFEESGGNQLDQVAVALGVFAQQHQMIGAALAGLRLRARVSVGAHRGCGVCAAIVAAAARHVHFAADDRLDAARGGFVVELLRGKKIAVIGDGHGGHLAARRFVDDLFNVASAVEKTVIGVQMQMNESRSFHAGRYSNLARKILLIRD